MGLKSNIETVNTVGQRLVPGRRHKISQDASGGEKKQ